MTELAYSDAELALVTYHANAERLIAHAYRCREIPRWVDVAWWWAEPESEAAE